MAADPAIFARSTKRIRGEAPFTPHFGGTTLSPSLGAGSPAGTPRRAGEAERGFGAGWRQRTI